jgi:undecaprenyl diphosphate synthase
MGQQLSQMINDNSKFSIDSFGECLDNSSDGIPVDLIVRTSGETRLSDFLLWQV